MRILTKYSLKEIIPNYFLGLAFFTLIFLVNEIFRLVANIVEKNIPIVNVLSLFIYTLPYVLATTIPIGVLIGIIFAIGRLSSDSEITAMRASGVSLLQIFYPCYWFGAIATITAVLFFQFVLPWGNQNYLKTYYKILRGNPAVNLMQNQVLNVEGLKIMVDSVNVKKQELYKVRIIDSQNGKILFAEWGRFLPRDDENNVFPLQLFFCTTQPYTYFPQLLRQETINAEEEKKKKNEEILYNSKIAEVEQQLLTLRKINERRALSEEENRKRNELLVLKKQLFDIHQQKLTNVGQQALQPGQSSKDKNKGFDERWDEISVIYIRDMTPENRNFTGPDMASITELFKHINKMKLVIKVMILKVYNQLVNTEVELRKIHKQLANNPLDNALKLQESQTIQKIKGSKMQLDFFSSGGTIDRQIVYEFHRKISIPFACFFLAMLAAPLGVFSKRSGKGIAIGVAFLILIGYWILMLVGSLGYSKNIMSPEAGAWLPNILTVFAGIFFTYQKITGKSFFYIRFDWVIELYDRIFKWWKKLDITLMQLFYYLFTFPFRLPFIITKKIIKYMRVQRFVSKRAKIKGRRVVVDDIFGDY